MNMNRRNFLKTASAAAFMTAFCPGKYLQAISEYEDVWGEGLRQTWAQTTLANTLKYGWTPGASQPLSIEKSSGEGLLIRNDLLKDKNRAPRKNPRSLLFFGQIADMHLVDEESPARLVAAEEFLELIGTRSAFHTQEDLVVWGLRAMMQTLDRISQKRRFDFLLNTGDSIDNAQENELDCFFSTLDGGLVNPDSGDDEDPVPGPLNDANDSFVSPGFLMNTPMYTAIGNHDVLLQGNIPPEIRELYNALIGDVVDFMVLENPLGDYSKAVITPKALPQDISKLKPGKIARDLRRMTLNGNHFVLSHLQHPTKRSFFGFPIDLAGKEQAYYSQTPKKDLPLRVIVLDTTSRIGMAFGFIDEEQYKDFLIPQLEEAKAAGELVIIVSHHPLTSIETLVNARKKFVHHYSQDERSRDIAPAVGELFASPKNFMTRGQILDTLKSYPNVFLHIAGHTHSNKITPVGEGLHGFWEVRNCSLMEFPQQARLFDIVYEGNGVGAVQTCLVDYEATKGSLSDRCREMAYLDKHKEELKSGRRRATEGNQEDRNSILRFDIPEEIAKKLEL